MIRMGQDSLGYDSPETEIGSIKSELDLLEHPRRNYGLLLVSNFMWFFGLGLYTNFLSIFLTSIGATPVEAGLFSSIMMASGILWTGLGGVLTTRFGVKPLLILGWIIVIPAPIIYILAQILGWQWALFAAFFEGTALLASAPFRTYTSHVTTRKRRGIGYSLIATSSAIAGIPAPTIGGLIISVFGYSNLFLFSVACYIISTLLLFPLTSVPQKSDNPGMRWRGDFLKNRVFILTTIFMGVIFSLSTFADFFVPLYLYDKFSLDESSIGVLFTILSTSGAILGPLLGVAGDRWGYTKTLSIPIIGSIGYYALLFIIPVPIFLPLAYIIRGLSYGGYILTNAIISHQIHPSQLPNAFATFVLTSRAITPFTPYIGGISYAIQPALPLIASSLILPINFGIIYLIYRAQKTEKHT
jgi:DHA1 family multidrug resistance protein-like MFS transporter